MRTKTITILFLGLNIALAPNKTQAHEIKDVYITPETPYVNDDITIFVSGLAYLGPVDIYDTSFFINDNSLTLDLYIDVGFLQVLTPWNHSEYIGSLPAGSYDLNVNTYYESNLADNYPFNFEVIPEPASMSILAIGSLLAFRRSRRRCSI